MVADLTEGIGDDRPNIAGKEVVDAVSVAELVVRLQLVRTQPANSTAKLLLAHLARRDAFVQHGHFPVVELYALAAGQWLSEVGQRANPPREIPQLALCNGWKCFTEPPPSEAEGRRNISTREGGATSISPVYCAPVQHILDHRSGRATDRARLSRPSSSGGNGRGRTANGRADIISNGTKPAVLEVCHGLTEDAAPGANATQHRRLSCNHWRGLSNPSASDEYGIHGPQRDEP